MRRIIAAAGARTAAWCMLEVQGEACEFAALIYVRTDAALPGPSPVTERLCIDSA